MKTMSKRWASSLAASSLVASGLALGTTTAVADTPLPAQECIAVDTANILSYNDFHGRISSAAEFFSIVEAQRELYGEENVLTISSGDDIGGSLFESMIDDDFPTLDVLNAIELDVQAVGNHEFDKGWADLSGRVNTGTNFNHLGANVYEAGTTTVAEPLLPYEIFEVAGLNVAVIGAVTADLPSLVDPSGISSLTIGNPVQAINREAAAITEAGTADLIIAAIHEGAGNGSATPEANAASSSAFSQIYNDISPEVEVIFNAHTHQRYNWTTPAGQILLQAGEYASHMNSVVVEVSAAGEICSLEAEQIGLTDARDPEQPTVPRILNTPRIEEIQRIVAAANDLAEERGSIVIGEASEAISTPTGDADTRDVESTMTNLVAQMFHDVLGEGDPNFIGVQNPGGTRSSFDAGEITYREAALALPFANSLMTTEITGAQVKTMLEQQWQRDPDGNVPSRGYLRLGLSDNVSYTYDENLPEGERITSIFVSGEPIDPEGTYTIGSGSFLISGGDNFRVIGEGENTRDTGRVDLEAWVDYIGSNDDPWAPDYSKRGVPVTVSETDDTLTLDLGYVLEDGLATDTLEMIVGEGPNVSPHVAAEDVVISVAGVEIATAEVLDGAVTVEIPLPVIADVDHLVVTVNPIGYEFTIPAEALWFGDDPGTPTEEPTEEPTATPTERPTDKPVRPGLPKSGV